MSVVTAGTAVVGTGLAGLAGLWGTVEAAEAAILGEAANLFEARFATEWAAIENDTATVAQLNEWNAFAHSYTSWRLADLASSGLSDADAMLFSHFMGDAREEFTEMLGNNSTDGRNQDEWNNAFGRELFDQGKTQAQVADRLQQEILDHRTTPNSSDLIINPTADSRDYAGPRALPDGSLFDDLRELAEDYGWAFDNPQLLPLGLPGWLQPLFSPVPGFIPGTTIPFGDGGNVASPIVLDIDASGTIELAALNAAGTVMWDIDEDGFLEASGWITGGDGLLCVDLNSDGIINDHGELFGGANGYVTLDAYDTNNDNAITSSDTDFGDLLVWVDTNADGYSQAAELHTLTSLGITSISTSYSVVNYTIAGNPIKYQSTFTMNGNSYTSVDAFFAFDTTNSKYVGSYTLDARVLYMPNLRGYGDLPDLYMAMSMDEDLLDMVHAFSETGLMAKIDAILSPGGGLEDILFRWAGVDGVSPTSRGSYVDARVLEFLEAFVGQSFVQGGNPNPQHAAIEFLTDGYVNAYTALGVRLLFQTTNAKDLFTGDVTYDHVTDTFSTATGIDLAEIEDWMLEAGSLSEQLNMGRFLLELIDQVIGIANLSGGDYSALEALLPAGVTIDALTNVMAGATTITGDSSDSLMFSSVSTDNLYGNGGSDIIISSAGNYDNLYGGSGDDFYVFTAGWKSDWVSESTSSGTDTIVMQGFDSADARMWTDGSGYLYIENRSDTADRVSIIANISGYSGTNSESIVDAYVEKIAFDDVTVTVTGGLSLEGTSSGEGVYGTAYNDQISGMAGGDYLYGNRGNDTLIGGAGNDTLYGGAGDDTYVFAAGSQLDYVAEATSAGTDTIRLTGYATTDVRLWTDSSGGLFIANRGDSGDQATFYAATTGASGTTYETAIGSYFEQIVFDDTTTWNLASGLTLEGSSGAENLYGSQYDDQINGMDGNDNVYGNRGNDTLTGGDGNDNLYGGAGDDTYVLAAGSKADYVTENTSSGTDTIRLVGYATTDVRLWTDNNGALHISNKADAADNATLYAGTTGASGTTYETAIGSYFEQIVFDDTTTWSLASGLTLEGTSSNEVLYGSQYGDQIYGMSGPDYLYGNRGNDTLVGGDGNDTMFGGDGNDVLSGGGGQDTLYGDGGADTFLFEAISAFSNVDFIVDFSAGAGDKIDLHDILDAAFDPGTMAIASFVDFTTSGSDSIMKIDQDGAGTTYGWQNVATISGGAGLDETTLYNNGNLLAA